MLFRNIYSVVLISGLLAGCAGDEDLPIQAEPSPSPHGRADNYAADADGALVVSEEEGVLANDGNAGPVDAEFIDGPQHAATFQLNSDGSFSYQYNGDPAADGDSFRYRVHDGEGETTDPITVGISLSAYDIQNVPPVAEDDSGVMAEDQSVTIALLDNDSDANDNLDSGSVTISAQPSNGVATVLQDGSVEYTPAQNFHGSDSFRYQVSDFAGATSNQAQVTLQIESVNDIPAGNDDSYVTNNQSALSRQLECEDADDDSHDYALVNAMPASEGTVSVQATGQFEFTPNNLFAGNSEFTFTCEDDEGGLSGNATITVTVNNPAPNGVDDSFGVAEGGSNNSVNVLANDSDAFGDPLTAILESEPSNAASFELAADGSVSYTHDDSETSSDTFTYRASDGNSQSALVTVSISITAVNDAPILHLAAPADGHATNYVAGKGSLPVLPENLALTDDNDAIVECIVSSETRPDGLSEQLTVTDDGGVTTTDNGDNSSYLLTASGNDSVEIYQNLLRSLSYNNGALNPTAGPRDIDIHCQDDSGQETEIRQLRINVYLTEARRISVSSTPANTEGNERSNDAAISTNGRYVVFVSEATNLTDHVYGDDESFRVFRRDLITGETILVTLRDGIPIDGNSQTPCINHDGSKIAFRARSIEFSGADGSNTEFQLYVADLSDPNSPEFTEVSEGFTRALGNCEFSGNGYLLFEGNRGNAEIGGISPDDTSQRRQPYRFDFQTQNLEAVANGGLCESDCIGASISGDGRFIAFISNYRPDPDLIPRDRHVYLRDMSPSAGQPSFQHLTPGTESSTHVPRISADGSRIVFGTQGTELVPDDNDTSPDLFVVDVETGVIGRVNTREDGTSAGTPTGMVDFGSPRISADGRYVTYIADHDGVDLTSEDNTGDSVYIKQLPEVITNSNLAGPVRRLDPREDESSGTGDVANLVHPDFVGDRLVFHTNHTQLVPNDTNQRSDVFETNNPLHVADVLKDSDGDGLTDLSELLASGSYPGAADSDRDGLSDLEEVHFGELENPDDAYNEGINTDPNNPDTDGDGELDGDEVAAGTNPLVAD